VVNIPSASAQPRCERERVVEFRTPPDDDLYLEAVASSLEELATHADALVLSLGYDTVAGDPHGYWELSPEVFTGIGRLLTQSGLPGVRGAGGRLRIGHAGRVQLCLRGGAA